jgi:hypothetical protein
METVFGGKYQEWCCSGKRRLGSNVVAGNMAENIVAGLARRRFMIAEMIINAAMLVWPKRAMHSPEDSVDTRSGGLICPAPLARESFRYRARSGRVPWPCWHTSSPVHSDYPIGCSGLTARACMAGLSD